VRTSDLAGRLSHDQAPFSRGAPPTPWGWLGRLLDHFARTLAAPEIRYAVRLSLGWRLFAPDQATQQFLRVTGADGGPVLPVTADPVEVLLNRTWRPALSITGIEGLPPLGSAGNVLRPFTTVKISMRIPPRLDPLPSFRADGSTPPGSAGSWNGRMTPDAAATWRSSAATDSARAAR